MSKMDYTCTKLETPASLPYRLLTIASHFSHDNMLYKDIINHCHDLESVAIRFLPGRITRQGKVYTLKQA